MNGTSAWPGGGALGADVLSRLEKLRQALDGCLEEARTTALQKRRVRAEHRSEIAGMTPPR
jgi:hypothetical protein